jgi:peptidoglycan/LPS O-acetylase OafA/YrhL
MERLDIAQKSPQGIDAGASGALDIARFLLALCVAGAHWSQHYFQDGRRDVLPLALAAVGAFFVLSGFTIRLTTAGAPFRLHDYLIKRLARLWSVVLPALLATAVLDSISGLLNPTFYSTNWPLESPLTGLFANAVFMTQMWGMDIVPLSNSPFWSIGYEAWFYLLYGLVLARKPILAVGMALLAGPNIWFLMSLWICGIGFYEVLARANTRSRLICLLCVSTVLCALDIEILAVHQDAVRRVYEHVLGAYFGFFHINRARVGLGSALPAGAVTFALSMLALLAAIKLVSPRVPDALSRTARWLGEFTFPLYLLHVPLFVLCASIGFYDRHSPLETVATFGAVCLVISFTVPLTNSLKRTLQRSLSRLSLPRGANLPLKQP